MKKKILLACYGGGHVKIAEHLYNTLSSDFDVTIFALTSARAYLRERGISFVSFSDFPDLISSRAIQIGKELAKDMIVLDYDETIAYMGVNYCELLMKYGEKKALEKYSSQGRGCFFPIQFINCVLDILTPDLVITTNSPRSERATLLAAKDRGVPSVCVSDNLWIVGGVSDVAQQRLASKICVMSEGMKQELISATRYPEQDIIVTGSPVFDSLKLRKSEWELKKLTRQKINILFADAPLLSSNLKNTNLTSEPEVDNTIREKLDLLGNMEGYNVFFRRHPNQEVDYTPFTNVHVSSPSEDLHDLLIETDIIITAISTVGLEGYLLGAKLITLENTIYRNIASYEKLGMSVGINSADELIGAIEKVLDSSRKSLNIEIYSGTASDNIKQVCESLL